VTAVVSETRNELAVADRLDRIAMDGNARLGTGKESGKTGSRGAIKLLVGIIAATDIEEAAGRTSEGAGGAATEGAPETRKTGAAAAASIPSTGEVCAAVDKLLVAKREVTDEGVGGGALPALDLRNNTDRPLAPHACELLPLHGVMQ